MANAVVWFDIPATDLDRAQKFYSVVLDAKIEGMPGMEGYVLPHKGEEVSGCIVKGPEHQRLAKRPAALPERAAARLDDAISKVEPNGRKIPQGQALGSDRMKVLLRPGAGQRRQPDRAAFDVAAAVPSPPGEVSTQISRRRMELPGLVQLRSDGSAHERANSLGAWLFECQNAQIVHLGTPRASPHFADETEAARRPSPGGGEGGNDFRLRASIRESEKQNVHRSACYLSATSS